MSPTYIIHETCDRKGRCVRMGHGHRCRISIEEYQKYVFSDIESQVVLPSNGILKKDHARSSRGYKLYSR